VDELGRERDLAREPRAELRMHREVRTHDLDRDVLLHRLVARMVDVGRRPFAEEACGLVAFGERGQLAPVGHSSSFTALLSFSLNRRPRTTLIGSLVSRSVQRPPLAGSARP
jgi:hypothetical protein